jgi:hypothetical protein
MSEWVDFCVYTVQALLLWIAAPRWLARFARPSVVDRNPEWAAANEHTILLLERGGWWRKAIQAWGVLSVLMLLLCRIDRMPLPFLTPQHKPSWELLMTTSNLLLMAGFVLFGYGIFLYMRWLKSNVPLSERRRATLVPRTMDHFIRRRVQYLVYTGVLVGLAARPIADLLWPGRLHDVWNNFFLGLTMSVVLFFVAAGSVLRPETHMDRMLGSRYRRMEVRLCFALMAYLTALGLVSLYLEMSGINTRRYGSLMVATFVCVTLVSCMRLPTQPGKQPPVGLQDDESDVHPRTLAVVALLVPLMLPVALLLQPPAIAI